MGETTAPTAPVRKRVQVALPPAEAFELFTAGIQRWWPLATHSVGEERAVAIHFPTGVGDQVVETLGDGTTAVWGTVLRSDPPRLVELTWHPGRDEGDATLLELRFEPDGTGGTGVELVHSGWERWEDGHARAASYEEGWDLVLGHFTDGAR